MMSKSKITRFLILSLAAFGIFFISGSSNETAAQTRDPFQKNPKLVSRSQRGRSNPNSPDGQPQKKAEPEKPKGPIVVTAPPIQQRIAYFMSMREQAALNGLPLPKVTSVLTLNEMSVIGIFKTPRGFAAMVEASPIKLSYTIYPGERFFDGQLVAVEENRLVFRKVTKMSNNKFISTVENKTLREFSVDQEIQGTVPVGSANTTQTVENTKSDEEPAESADNKSDSNSQEMIISPLDEMKNQSTEEKDESAKKQSKKKTKVARKP